MGERGEYNNSRKFNHNESIIVKVTVTEIVK